MKNNRRISREWRQKIESWLQANEQDEKHGDEHKRRTRRLTGNRRSFENDSENERSKLDPLPEEKAAVTTTPPQANEPYKRVYPDWKPTTSSVERGDSESTQDLMSKEKDDTSSRPEKMRASQSSTSLSSSATPLQSIMEEDRRTSQDIPLKINVRRPSEVNEYEPVYQKHTSPVGITSDSHSIYIRPSVSNKKSTATSPERRESITKCHSQDAETPEPLSNKIEIDSDNIETPPVVRKNIMSDDKSSMVSSVKKLQAPRPLHQRTIDESKANESVENKPNETEVLGDGHFDRHSSARRTRRYRRPTDHSSGAEDRNDSSPETVPATTPVFPPASSALYSTSAEHDVTANSKDDVSPDRGEDMLLKSKSMDILSRIGKHGRNMSSINQEAVREAIRKLKSPTETPERIWSPPREIVVTPKDRIIPSKVINHELNDEGFEETQSCQSLVSDGKDSTSSCNEPADHSQSHLTASLSPNQSKSKSKSVVKSLIERNRQSLERSRSLRAVATPHSRTSIIPKRTNSLRRNIDTGAISANRQDVERSGSRTSLRSSRSSLNSSASINTVRNMGLKPTTTQSPSATARHLSNSATEKTSLRKKLAQQQSNPSSNTQKATLKGSNSLNSYLRTPASRSSSSGSSIGGPSSSRQSYTKTSSSNSATPPISNSPQRPAFRNTVSVSNHLSTSSSQSNSQKSANAIRSSSKLNNLKGIASKTSNRVSSFMRPTTSSATKVNSPSNRSK
ncbi:serine/arginine repetitive matrix protein 2-like isoform X2 [Contarinia nasturtii]|uniref:serine/arginine repetitive matrix protein 2-like isoform X2 n=1 Tax=Contarinia nasturtii TaxID=265458 RepID=UPI0012D41AB3|nr:serine/arginine repetitive matrix protein 2-like isoform X2 [Contarinia nasturtii]